MAVLNLSKGDYQVTAQDILDTLAGGGTGTGDLHISGNLFWKSGTSFEAVFDHANTGIRTYTFPNASGTIPLLSNPQTWTGVQTFNTLTLKATDIIFTTSGPKIIGGSTLQMINSAGNFFKVTIGPDDRIIAGTNVGINLNNSGEKFQILNSNSFERIRYEFDDDSWSPLDNISSNGKTGRRWTAVWAVNGTIQTSFSKFKKNIETIQTSNCLNVIRQIDPIKFQWNDAQFANMEDDDPMKKQHMEQIHLGINADPLIANCPEAVAGEDGIYMSSVIALLLGAVRDLDSQVQSMKK